MGNPGEAKYGMTKEQIFQGVKDLMALGAERFGLHAFLASNTTDNSYYPKLAEELFELARETRDRTRRAYGVCEPIRRHRHPLSA